MLLFEVCFQHSFSNLLHASVLAVNNEYFVKQSKIEVLAVVVVVVAVLVVVVLGTKPVPAKFTAASHLSKKLK